MDSRLCRSLFYSRPNSVPKLNERRTMSKPKTPLNIIKPQLGVIGMTDGDLLARLNAVHDGKSNNSLYPNPPVDMPGFKAAIDAFTAASAAVLHDGGRTAIAERNKRRADAIIMLRLLGHYVEVACKGDTKAFVSSG